MKNKLIPLLFAATAVVTACKQDNTGVSSAAVIDPSEAIAEVNGIYISKASLDTLKKDFAQRSRGQTMPEQQMIDELVSRELLVQEAEKKKLNETAEFTANLENVKRSLLAQAALQDYMQANPITDEEIKAAYDKQVGGTGGTEYKARHILVKTEDEAKALIKKLDKGEDFVELAKKNSTGPSAPKGGDLGWFSAQQMVPPFSEAVIAMDNGKYTTVAVQTQFGWHVILREDSRAKTPPPLASVQEQLRPMLQREKVQAHLDALRNQADVNIMAAAPAALAAPEKPQPKSAIVVEEEVIAVEAEPAPEKKAEPAK